MVIEFNGFTEGVIGKKLPSDTTLNNMRKSELIELLHIAQHNYDTLMWFNTNAVNANMRLLEENKEIRNKAIDEFLHKLFEVSYDDYESDKLIVEYADAIEIAEQMKEV